MSLPVEEIIADLINTEQVLRNSMLVDLSNLSLEELELLQPAWTNIELKRRRQIIYRLVELAEDNCELDFDSIFRNCLKDQDADIRGKAVEGLWESEDASLINPFINLLEQDSSVDVQVAAATALGKFVMLAELNKLRSCRTSRICQALLSVFSDENRAVEVRRRALEAVAPLNLPQVGKIISEAYHSHSRKFKISAIYAMGKNCDRSWLPVLLEELSSADTEIRYEAAGACGELGEEEAVLYLMKLIGDPDFDVQVEVLRALGKIGGGEAKKCLQQCLNNPKEVVRQAAEQALDELETEERPFTSRM